MASDIIQFAPDVRSGLRAETVISNKKRSQGEEASWVMNQVDEFCIAGRLERDPEGRDGLA